MKKEIIDRINHFNSTNCTSLESRNMNWFLNFMYFRFNEDGSFTCKKENPPKFNEQGLIWDLLNENSFNFMVAGDDGCLGNFDMYVPLYSFDTEYLYNIPYETINAFGRGEEITVYGREVTEEEFHEILEYNM